MACLFNWDQYSIFKFKSNWDELKGTNINKFDIFVCGANIKSANHTVADLQ